MGRAVLDRGGGSASADGWINELVANGGTGGAGGFNLTSRTESLQSVVTCNDGEVPLGVVVAGCRAPADRWSRRRRENHAKGFGYGSGCLR